ncbi:DUF4360 domain-containing protein [Pilimelia columellifera]
MLAAAGLVASVLTAPAQASPIQIGATGVPIAAKLTAAGGSGCKKASTDKDDVKVTTTADGTVAVTYPTIKAEPIGVVRINRKNCNAQLGISVPAGYTWGIEKISAHGKAKIEGDAHGSLYVDANVAGVGGSVVLEHEVNTTGAFDPSVQSNAAVGPTCGEQRDLLVNTSVLAGKSRYGSSTVEISYPAGEKVKEAVFIKLVAKQC